MRAIVQFCREESNLSSDITHISSWNYTLPVCECVLYMHAQTCARAYMCDVVVACIRGMKGRRLFFDHAGPKVRLGGKYLHSLSHLTGPH